MDLSNTSIESLGNLTSVEGDLFLHDTPLKSLGNLKSVGGDLDLQNTSIKSFENLTSVGGYLDLWGTPLSRKYTERSTLFVATDQIRQIVNVGGDIIL